MIYEKDEFEYTIDTKTGRVNILKHEQKIQNIDNTKIIGAYAIVTLPDGTTTAEIMSIQQIRAAWNQGATKGGSPAHSNFTDQMCKKTVIGRACKMYINSSNDAWLYEDKRDEFDTDVPAESRNQQIAEKANKKSFQVQDVAFEEVPAGKQKEEPQKEEESTEPEQPEQGNDMTAQEEPQTLSPGW